MARGAGVNGRGGVALPHLRNERGMLLVVTLIILLVLSTLGAASLVNAYLERSLARNQHAASLAQNAADAGVTAGLAWLNDPLTSAALPAAVAGNEGWSVTRTESFTVALKTGGETETRPVAFTTTLRFKREGDGSARCDADGCGDDEVVLYNTCTAPMHNCFGYPQSGYRAPAALGFPVIQIVSEGRYGEAAVRRLQLEVARDKLNVQARGAVSAASNVAASGNITIDGRSHDIDGNLGGNCSQAFTGVSVPPPLVDHNGDGLCNCSNGVTNGDGDCADAGEVGPLDRGCYAATKDGTAGLAGSEAGVPSEWQGTNANPPLTPDAALGMDEGDLDTKLGGLPAAGVVKILGNITYSNADYDLSTGGSGILIIHNPLFESRKWSFSDPAGEDFKVSFLDAAGAVVVPCGAGRAAFPNYDPKLDSSCGGTYDAAYAAARAPRNLEQHGNNTFKGVIIADKIDKINGTADIIGAVISLSAVSVDKLGNGAARILYSCDAIAFFTDQGYSIKLGWQRVVD